MVKSILLVVLFSQVAVAEVETSQVTGQIVASPQIPASKYPSVYNRQNKNVMMTAQLAGMGPGPFSTGGVSVGTFLTPDLILSGELTTVNSAFYSSTYETIHGYSLGLHLKHFVGNTFYYRAGYDYRDIQYTDRWDWNWSGSSPHVEKSFDGYSHGVTAAIGNQWQFESFTLGCDWFGWSVPFTHYVRNSELKGNYDSYDRKSLKNEEDRYLKNPWPVITRFYLGASF